MILSTADSRETGKPELAGMLSRLAVRRKRAGGQSASAFTLVEIVLALAVIATAFIAILGLLPAGLDASRQAANSTVVASVLEDLNNRLQNRPLVPKTGGGNTQFTAWFDDRGVYIPLADTATGAERTSALTQHRALYRADVKVADWRAGAAPVNTSALRPVTISLSWPVDANSGNAMGKDNPKTIVTYEVTTLTGSDWPKIDPDYVPKIEF